MAEEQAAGEVWAAGEAYESYVGRWSRLVARELVRWIEVPEGSAWLDVGCGTGALAQTILDHAGPRAVFGVDRSGQYVAHARARIDDPRGVFQVGDAQALPVADAMVDAVVSGLVLNFVPEPRMMIAEMARVARRDGTVALYVWDYAGRMELMRFFWDAAKGLDARAGALDEGARFPICSPRQLAELLDGAGLGAVQTRAIDVLTRFRDFDDYWSPFLGGQGPAPGYAMSLLDERREALRERIRAAVPFEADGSISLTARAWAVRGRGHACSSR
jgi:SAM-dependent methyltransferase